MSSGLESIPELFAIGRRKVFGRATDGLNNTGVFILICNTMNGPGILGVPFVYQMGGLIVPTISLLLIAWVSITCGAMFASALATAKQAKEAKGQGIKVGELEFCSVIKIYFGRRVELMSQALLTVCLTSLALAQMVIGCQTIDAFIVFAAGRTYGLQYAPAFEVVSSSELSMQPFGTGKFMVSLGFAVCCVVCLGLGRLNLSENLFPQVLSFLLFVFSVVTFFWYFARPETAELKVSNLNGWLGQEVAGVLGIVIFNFSYVVAVPSLCNEKADKVEMQRPIIAAVLFMLTIYFAMGLMGDAAFDDEDSDILATILQPDPDSGATPAVAKFAVFAFAHAIVPCIPLYCVLIGYNLRDGFGMAPWLAYTLSNVVPWLIALILVYQPFFSALVGWSSLLVSGFVNFTIPLLLVLKVRLCHATENGFAMTDVASTVPSSIDAAILPGDASAGPSFAQVSSIPLVDGLGSTHMDYENVKMTWANVWALSKVDPEARKAFIVMVMITAVLVFTIFLNIVYWAVVGKDYVAGDGGGTHIPFHP